MAFLDTLQGLASFGLRSWGQYEAIVGAKKSAKATQSGQAVPVIQVQLPATQAAAQPAVIMGGAAQPAAGLSTNTMLLIGGAVLAAVLVLPKLMR